MSDTGQNPDPTTPEGRAAGTDAADETVPTESTSFALPMFPLGSVLLPFGLLPLHIFEPRYRAMLRDVLAADRRFGVVLIERGSEVGGGDKRTAVGTLARIERNEESADGRSAVLAVGEQRLVVESWLDDDPYPRAMVRRVTDPEDEAAMFDESELVEAQLSLIDVFALAEQLGRLDQRPDVRWSENPSAALWQLAGITPAGPLDRQSFLTADTPAERLARVAQVLLDVRAQLQAELDLRSG